MANPFDNAVSQLRGETTKSSSSTAKESGGYSSATQGYSSGVSKKQNIIIQRSSKRSKKSKTTSQEIDRLIDKNVPQVNQKIEQVSQAAKDYKAIQSFEPKAQRISRLISPQETMTTQEGNRLMLNPSRGAQEFMSLKQEQDIAEAKYIEERYGANAPKKEIRRYFGIQTGLFVAGVGEGAVAGINPLLIAKGTYDAVSNPVGYFRQAKSYYAYNPAGFFGNVGGQAATSSLLGSGVSAVSPKFKPYIVGKPKSFRESSKLFIKGADWNTMMGKFEGVKGTGTFKFDSSLGLRTRTLESVTGDRYFAQSQLFGEGFIKKPVEKGFLAKEGFDLSFKPPKDNLVISSGQTKLFGDTIKKFPRGKTVSPNVMLRSKSLEATNPRYDIVDFINPLRNKYYERPSTQTTLFKVDTPKVPVTSRNTLKELYNMKSLVSTDDIPRTSFINKPIKFKPIKKTESSSGGQVSSLKMSDATFDAELSQLPRTSMRSVLESKNVPDFIQPSTIGSIKPSVKFVSLFKPSSRSRTFQLNLFKNKQDNNLRLNNIPKLDQQPAILQRQQQQQKQTQVQITLPKLRTVSRGKTVFPYRPSPSYQSRGFVSPPKPFILKPVILFNNKSFPKLKKNVLPKFKPKSIKYSYAPSLEAGLFNVRSRKIDLNLARSGLTLRPIRMVG